MKKSNLFWGLLLVTLGLLFFVANVFDLQINLGDIYVYWPIILILFGLTIFLKQELPRTILTALSAILLGLIVFNLLIRPWGCVKKRHINSTVLTDSLSYPYEENFKNVNLHLKGGAASFSIQPGSEKLFLLKGYNLDESVSYDVIHEPDYVKVIIKSEDIKFQLDRESVSGEFFLELNENPAYNLKIDLGAAEGNLDFSNLKIKNLDVDIGAAKLDLKIGTPDADTLFVDIDAGASSIKILFPDSLGAEIYSDLSLSSKKFTGFSKVEKNIYRTENFAESNKKVIFRISGGVIKVRVNPY